MELRQLEHFIAVAEAKHFTRAAEALSISQSGLSASIRALERELHGPLFIRHTRRVELTETGRALLAESRRTLASADAAKEAVAAVQGLLRGRLAVGSEQCVGGVDVPGILASFRSHHPGVQIRFRQAGSQTLLEELRSGRLDVAFIGSAGSPEPGVQLIPVISDPMVLICRPDHRFATRSAVGVDEICEETFIDFPSDSGARRISDQAFAAAGTSHRVELEVGDVHTLLDLVLHGMGVALVPRPIAAKKAKDLVQVPLKEGSIGTWQVALAVPEGAAFTLAAQSFVRTAGAEADVAEPDLARAT